jgi:hypothetical protein
MVDQVGCYVIHIRGSCGKRIFWREAVFGRDDCEVCGSCYSGEKVVKPGISKYCLDRVKSSIRKRVLPVTMSQNIASTMDVEEHSIRFRTWGWHYSTSN